ncbi:MAG: hypothetical protein IH889_09625 [Planctomycetes bacterium]|nr:hypothetical protein [Planctomycetota bacterium]
MGNQDRWIDTLLLYIVVPKYREEVASDVIKERRRLRTRGYGSCTINFFTILDLLDAITRRPQILRFSRLIMAILVGWMAWAWKLFN